VGVHGWASLQAGSRLRTSHDSAVGPMWPLLLAAPFPVPTQCSGNRVDWLNRRIPPKAPVAVSFDRGTRSICGHPREPAFP
jgi:hypothetical protein